MSEVNGPQTPLQRECAASNFGAKNVERVKAMLDSGVDPNEVDGFKRSALNLLCSQTGYTDAVRLLLEAGANVMSQDMWGRTPLHWCADRGWLEAAHLLLEKGAEVNTTTKNGDSPLLWAAKAGHHSLAELLLKSGCDPLLRNNRNECALDVSKDDVTRALLTSKLDEVEDTTIRSPVSPQRSPKKRVQAEALPALADKDIASIETEEKTEINLEVVKASSTSFIPTNSTAFSSYSKQTASASGPKKLKITLKKK